MRLIVEEAALWMSVQDRGRYGYQRFGLPESGPMDWWAFSAASWLVGNQPMQAGLECGFSTASLIVDCETLMAVCGAGYHLSVNGRTLPMWMSFSVRKGDQVRLQKVAGGNWAYLAVAGGIQSETWLGSRSTYSRAGLGANLAIGDHLPLKYTTQHTHSAGRSMPTHARPHYQRDPLIGVIPGPHQERFSAEIFDLFWAESYRVSTRSDRMGYRLRGARLNHRTGPDLVSQGMMIGQIQIPGDGQPIVMMPDHPTTGGYTSIAVVSRADLPLLVQAEPGLSNINFRPVSIAEAQESYAAAVAGFQNHSDNEEDLWLHL